MTVSFADLLEPDDAEITTQTAFANGGNITIMGGDLINVRNSGEISSTVADQRSAGLAGNIDVTRRFLVLDDGHIRTAGVRGQGGSINIGVDNLVRSPGSVVQALSELRVTAQEGDVSGGLMALPAGLFDASAQLRESCAARRSDDLSSFTASGRGGLPLGPGAPLPGFYADLTAPAGGGHSARRPDKALRRPEADLRLGSTTGAPSRRSRPLCRRPRRRTTGSTSLCPGRRPRHRPPRRRNAGLGPPRAGAQPQAGRRRGL